MANPYETPEAELHVEGNFDNTEYVGFWARVWASIVDSIIMIGLIFVFLFAFYGFEKAAEGAEEPLTALMTQLVFPILFVLLFWMYRAATPGKTVVKSIIVDAKTGEPISKGQCVIRYIGYYISMIPLFLGFIWVAFDKRKQGWHDKIAGTVVIRDNSNTSGN